MQLQFFSHKNVSQIACKIFATQCFFADHLKHKTGKQNNFQNVLNKSSPTMFTFVGKFSNLAC